MALIRELRMAWRLLWTLGESELSELANLFLCKKMLCAEWIIKIKVESDQKIRKDVRR